MRNRPAIAIRSEYVADLLPMLTLRIVFVSLSRHNNGCKQRASRKRSAVMRHVFTTPPSSPASIPQTCVVGQRHRIVNMIEMPA
jgi:hypothetical protein